MSNADERADWVPLDYRDLSTDRGWWEEKRCDQPLPEELRAFLDGLRRPPSPFTIEDSATFGVITAGGHLRYDLAPVGDPRPRNLAPAPVETWIEAVGAHWDTGCQNLLAAHGLVERAWDIMDLAGVDLAQFQNDVAADAGYYVAPIDGGAGVSMTLYAIGVPDINICIFNDHADERVRVTLDPESYEFDEVQVLYPDRAAEVISRAWRDAALGPHRDGLARADARMVAVARWAQAQGALAGATVDVRPRFSNMGGGRVEIPSLRIELFGPQDKPPAWQDSMVLEVTAADPGTVTMVEEGAWGPENREPLTVREAMDRVRQTFPDAATAVLAPAPAATVYTKENCIACQMTERQFAKAGVDVEVVRLEDHPEVVERAREMGLMSAPLVATPDGRITSGFDPQRIRDIAALASAPPGAGLAVSQPRPEGGIAASPAPERGRGMGL
ncbi:glutaredoxin domain-containing protein [Actinomyces sp. zg296]|uniref:glutaredoxin domain-containing protein n=1 Tax=Actinomyces sp. zg296 TaxID=2609289 RepID=UPI00135A8118|nr:glutaredoxin domain-containing protein [Actinomyces sp. zg296]